MKHRVFQKKLKTGFFEVYSEKPNLPIIQVHQVHSNIVVPYQDEDLSHIQADGIIAQLDLLEHKCLAIKTADCLPLLFLSKQEVALIHAGWVGIRDKIHLDQKVQQMNPESVLIGPSIRRESFEVQKDFYQHFSEEKYFYKDSTGKLFFDLQQKVIDDILCSMPNIEIYDTNIDTFKDNHFHSYRQNQTSERNWNIFKL
jgi:YfiH family protein